MIEVKMSCKTFAEKHLQRRLPFTLQKGKLLCIDWINGVRNNAFNAIMNLILSQ